MVYRRRRSLAAPQFTIHYSPFTTRGVLALPVLLVAGLAVLADRCEGLGEGVLAFCRRIGGGFCVGDHLQRKRLEVGLVLPNIRAGLGIALVAAIREKTEDDGVIM